MWSDPEATDAELLASADVSGTAFAQLYARHVDDVLRYFMRRTGCAQTSADLTSETFAAALTSRRRFRDIGAPGRAWLFKIAERQLYHYIRREKVSQRARQRIGMQPIVLDDDRLEEVERLADYAAIADNVRDAVADLPAAQAAALRLRVADGLAYREVADQLGCTEGAARVRVSRALTNLADQLGELR